MGLSGAPELNAQPLQPEDEFILLGSDGLWQLLDSQVTSPSPSPDPDPDPNKRHTNPSSNPSRNPDPDPDSGH